MSETVMPLVATVPVVPEYTDIMSILQRLLTEIQTANETLKTIATNTTPKK